MSFEPILLAGAALLLVTAALLFAMAFRPAIEVRTDHLLLGNRFVRWADIRRLDSTIWISPLVVRLTLSGGSTVLLVYPGRLDSCNRLRHSLRHFSKDALIDGIPYGQYWG